MYRIDDTTPCPDLGNPPLPGIRIESRLVVGILMFECVMCQASQTRIGFRTQDLLQRRYGTCVLREAPQPPESVQSRTLGSV